MKKLLDTLDSYFEITVRDSKVSREILAGVSTYLSLAYIFIVNPAILKSAGFNQNSVLFATIIASGLSTLFMGLYARLPLALAPGLEMNGFVAFVIIPTLGLTWQQSLGAVFWSGVLCWVLSVLPVRERIVKSIPDGLKANMAISVGVFVMVIGFFLADILGFKDGKLSTIGSFTSPKAIALYIGFATVFLLDWSWLTKPHDTEDGKRVPRFPGGSLVPGSFLIAIVAGAVYCHSQGIVEKEPASFSSEMLGGIFQLDFFGVLANPKFWPVFLVLFLIDFYGSIGKFIGLTAATNLRDPAKGVKNIEKAMQVDGAGTVAGALVGTTSIITYVESAVGITAGGRTGLVAVVCGLLMLASILFTPLVGLIHVVATSGILVYVGFLLLPRDAWREGRYLAFDAGVGIIMALISFFTFSLDKAMAVGFIFYTIRQFVVPRESADKPDWYLIAATICLAVSVVLQYALK